MLLMATQGETNRIDTMWAYLWLSTMWFIASYLASKSYITANGIVKNLNEPSQTIAWFNINDFAELDTKNGKQYTFVYREDENSRIYHRLTLEVPLNRINEFKKIVSYRLEKRMENDLIKITSEEKEK